VSGGPVDGGVGDWPGLPLQSNSPGIAQSGRPGGLLAAKMDEELGRERSARKKIHEDFAAMAGDVKVLQAETGRQTATLGELKVEVQSTNARIDAVPGRVINLLRETKGLIQ